MNAQKPLSILIVDDDPDHVFLARAALQRAPHWVAETAGTVAAAKEKLREAAYGAVVADFRLPDGEGLDLIDSVPPDTAVVVMTAQGNERVAVEAMQRGAYDYLIKDISFPELLPDVIQKALNRHRSRIEGARQQATVRKENRKLVQANQKLKELDAAKSEFLSTASHELRTPLTIIREFISIMRDGLAGPISDDQRECLDSALGNCDRLETLINDILDLQKIESGRLRIRRRRSDVSSLLRQCYHDFLPRFATRQQTLELDVDPSLPPALCDEDKIGQVLINLLGNANKYAPNGARVVLSAQTRGGRLVVSVEDDGPGIPAEDQVQVFEKFVQLNRQHGKGAKGTGLGLAIAKNIVELHEGDIWLQSTLGAGSTFYFTLPLFTEDRAVEALVRDRLLITEVSGAELTVTLVKIDPESAAATFADPEARRQTLEHLQSIATAQLRRREDEVFVADSETMLIIITESDASEGEAIAERVTRAVGETLGVRARLRQATVTVSSGIDPRDWIAAARERLSPVEVALAGERSA